MATGDYRVAHDEERLLNSGKPSTDDGLGGEKWTTAPVEDDPSASPIDKWLRSLKKNWAWVGHIILLSVSAILFTSSFCVRNPKPSDLQCTEKFAAWSPVRDSLTYETVHFDLPIIPEGPYVGKGPEVDAAWEAITDLPDIMISAEEMAKINMPTENALFITDPDTGKQGYRVAIEVFHQLHCLNLLRQNRFFSHYSKTNGDVAAEEEDLTGHLDHCIDALRQMIMCNSDVGVFPFYYETANDPWPNYATPHTCRNYEGVRKWALEHGVRRGPDEPEH